ncbi:hypothetical protein [Thalassotalea castellviae]|uniref:Uncharacterized protein n=1 Tax=Thalassotalea castellviae TaxID=3075612 RepID=A0ABU2ZYU9_9GAMM|nr:hypothetical protein [Thalassotalea sp. W431]MDT0602808.1 hypothetical protein [Thalassotalea sp. W431]
MFKKTLLALSIAGIAGFANAGTVVTSVTEVANGAAVACNGDAVVDDTASNVDGVYEATGTTNTTPAVGATCVIAETLVTTPTSSSIEAAQNVAVPANASLVAGIGGYEAGDTITINISGAQIDTATSLSPTLTDASGVLTINVLDITATAVRFTVTAGTSAGYVILNLTGINLDATGLSASTEVTYDAFATNTSGTDFDVSSGVVVADLVPQYSATVVDSMDGIIDVSADRKSLALNADDAHTGEVLNQDTLAIAVSLDATGTIITPATVEYVFSGDFSWLETAANTSDDGKAATAAEVQTYLGGGFYTGTGDDTLTSTTLNADMDTLTVITAAVSGDVDTAGEFLFPVQGNVTGAAVLNETPYSVSITAKDATAAPNTISMSTGSKSAGEWNLNGSVVTVPYMPFDDNTAVIMRHTNTGVQTGDISVRYMLEGVSTAWSESIVVGSSSRGVMNIRDAVINAIKADAGVTSGKVAIEITTNVPAADVTVYAAYKVKDEQDRGFVGTFGQHGSAN